MFASGNDTVLSLENSTVVQADYYFDANTVNTDGKGTLNNPYKELDLTNVSDNSVIHIANGEYTLEGSKTYKNLTVIGQNPEKTIVRYYDSVGFSSNGLITLKNVTLLGLKVNLLENSNFTAINTIFGENYVGNSVIYSSLGGNTVILDHCTFNNNSAQYGGAIKLPKSILNIKDSVFAENHASNWGGAIACEDSEITMSNCRFIDNYAESDAGGAIYLKDSKLIANKLEVINCSSLFGGAIVSLSSDLNLNNGYFKNNKAKYYGGAIFKMFTSFELENSIFEDNYAFNGGALYVADVEDFKINSNSFINNYANSTGGAIYSIFSYSYYNIEEKSLNNTFKNNIANSFSDIYQDYRIYVIQDGDYNLMHLNPSYDGNLPKSYDLRSLGFVTPIRNQGSGGNCWSFSASAALESAILKASGVTYDLSEENMKNIASKYSEYGWAMETNSGGYDKMAIGYLTSWLGPANESDDAYNPKSLLSPLLNTSVHIQNIVFLTRSNYTDNDAIKKAIMDYGAVSTSVYWSGSYVKNSKNYYYNGSSGANHAVAIVGWNDDYSASNFKTTPPGNGAWIVKNSWGANSGEKGFYYVSYYDAKLAQPGKYVSYAFVLNDTIKYDKNYQYDIPGRTDYFFNESATVWYKNKFTATDDEYLAAVSTYFEKDTDWELSVYVNNILKLMQSGSANPSYKTIDLNSLIPLKTGDIFEIVFKITTSKEAGVPISEYVSLNSEFYTDNISFISYDGKNWKDLYDLEWTYPDHSYLSQVACIKAFTVLNKIDTEIILDIADSYNPVEIRAKVLTKYGSLVNSGKVTFNVEGKNIDVNVVNGIAKISYAFKNIGNNNVKATFSGVGFNGATSNMVVNLKNVVLTANDLTAFFGNFTYSAKLVNENNKPVANKEIKFNVNNKDYVSKTDKNGFATIKLNLPVGNYNISVGFNDLSKNTIVNLVKKIAVKTTVDIPTYTKYTFNAKYSFNLVDSNGKALKSTKVNLDVNGKQQNIISDSYGNVYYTINLTPGSYKLTIINPVTGEVKTQTINVVARISENKDFTCYYGSESFYKFKVLDDNGNPAKNVQVTSNVNGKTYTEVTDNNGFVSFEINFNPGTYNIETSYKGYSITNNIAVKSTIALQNKNYTYNSNYNANFLDKKGNKYDGKVQFVLNGIKYEVNADEGVNINLKPGIYLVNVVNLETGEIKNQTINIKARLTGNKAITMYYGAGSVYKVRAYDDNGKVAAGVKVKFTIGDKTYSRYTDPNGYASFKITQQAGKYTITAKYKGYKVSNKVVVKPTLVLSTKTVKKSKTFKYTVKLLNKKGKILKYKKVTVKFRGKTYKVKTNYKGIATFKIKAFSKVGKFTLTASYGSAKVSKKITIKK